MELDKLSVVEKIQLVENMMNIHEVVKFAKISKTKIYTEVRLGKLPKPMKYNYMSVWFKADIADYVVRQLVKM